MSYGRKLAPGVYESADRPGQIEVDIPELLRHFGWPDTEANRETCLQTVMATFRKLSPKTQQFVGFNQLGQQRIVPAQDYKPTETQP